jgi:hypothetical protein
MMLPGGLLSQRAGALLHNSDWISVLHVHTMRSEFGVNLVRRISPYFMRSELIA